jgi:hypothetical protein
MGFNSAFKGLNQVVATTFSSRVTFWIVNLTNSGFLSHFCRCYGSLVSCCVKNKTTTSAITSSFSAIVLPVTFLSMFHFILSAFCRISNSEYLNVIDVAALLTYETHCVFVLTFTADSSTHLFCSPTNNTIWTAEGHSSFFHLKNTFDLETFLTDGSSQLKTLMK